MQQQKVSDGLDQWFPTIFWLWAIFSILEDMTGHKVIFFKFQQIQYIEEEYLSFLF